jgi:hypothetical protein
MERTKRNYANSFRASPWHESFSAAIAKIVLPQREVYRDPPLDERAVDARPGVKLFHFHSVPLPPDLFAGVQAFRNDFREELWKSLTQTARHQIETANAPHIGLHVRLGDFAIQNSLATDALPFNQRTPISYFVAAIHRLRAHYGECLPVTVFSDGRPNELEPLLRIPQTNLAEKAPDAVDLLLLSRSRVIVTSALSTFGYVAAYLSEADVIRCPYESRRPIRSSTRGQFEGTLDELCVHHQHSRRFAA